MSKLCLLFLRAVSDSQSVPVEVESLVKDRVVHQIEAQVPDLDVRFDEGSCSELGTYSFSVESLVLSASTSTWRGRLDASLSQLLDARPLDLSTVLPSDRLASAATSRSSWPRAPLVSPVATWVGLGALAGAGAGVALSPNRASRWPNAVVFGLVGAATGALLSFTF